MSTSSDDAMAARMLREFENRIVWVASFVTRMARGRTAEDAAKDADGALDEYQTRFPAIPPEGPS